MINSEQIINQQSASKSFTENARLGFERKSRDIRDESSIWEHTTQQLTRDGLFIIAVVVAAVFFFLGGGVSFQTCSGFTAQI